MDKQIGNPTVFALSAFGFCLIILGINILVNYALNGAMLFSLLFAGGLLLIASLWQIARGDSFLANVSGLFGGWFICYYLLLTQGKGSGLLSPVAEGAFILALLPPIIFLIAGAFRAFQINILISLVILAIFFAIFGIGTVLSSASWLFVAGIISVLAGVAIWWATTANLETLS